jgi:hypothetical protein
MFHMVYIPHKCLIWFYLDITYVTVVIHKCCKYMFQVFHLFQTYVVSVSSRCCICFRHMLQASIQNVSSVSNICCKCVYMDVVVVIHIYCKPVADAGWESRGG